MVNAFHGASNLDITATDTPDLSSVSNLSYMFAGASSLVGNASFAAWDTSHATNIRNIFFGAALFNQPVNSWNVSRVTSMRSVFNGARSFNQPLNNWNVSKVQDMAYMFRSATVFNQPLNTWDVSGVTEMQYMFESASAFNQPLHLWDTARVTTMTHMFNEASAFNRPINSWNTSNVTDMSYMFRNASLFNQPLHSWDTSKVTTMTYMFYGANTFNGTIGAWNTSRVTDMNNMFHNAISFNQPIGTWDTSRVTTMRSLFNTALSFDQPLNTWNVSNVTNMSYMFIRANAFDRPLNTWNVTAVTAMSGMLNESGLSIANYDGILNSWSTQAVKPRVSFGAIEKYYCTAQAARNILTGTPHRWTITDAGQACPPTSITLSNTNVPENTTTVGTISSTGINMPHTYTLVEGVGSEDNTAFILNAETGALTFVTAPDFENPSDLGASVGSNTYAIRVQAKNAVGLTTEKNFIITVSDVDDVPPIVTIIPTTKASTGPITDTVIEISDRFSIASVAVDNLSTAAADSLSCAPIPGSTTDSVDFPYINNAPSPTNHITIHCSIRITSTGKLAITAAGYVGL